MTVMPHSNDAVAAHEKHSAALSSVIAAIFLTFFKLVVGLSTGSLGILAEVAHSGLDLVAAVVTLFAVRVSGRPADKEHTYGHGKVENLSALFETVLLLVTCAWIIYEAIQRLFFEEVQVEVNIWAFIVMGVAIVIDFTRSRMLYRTAKKYDSQALEADALALFHRYLVVRRGHRRPGPGLAVRAARHSCACQGRRHRGADRRGDCRLRQHATGRPNTIAALLDGVPASVRDDVVRAVRVPGVLEVRRVRVRRSGPESFADVRLTVARDTPLEKTHEIAVAAESAVRQVLPGADVVVQVDPVKSDHEGVLTTVRMLAAEQGMGAHGVRIYDLQSGGHLLELHLEVSDALTVEQAHERASAFEEALRKTLPSIDQVVTHLSRQATRWCAKRRLPPTKSTSATSCVNLERENGLGCKPHDITVRTGRGRAAGDLPLHRRLQPADHRGAHADRADREPPAQPGEQPGSRGHPRGAA